MKAVEANIDTFLTKTDTVFAIPVYQRNYDWKRKPHCEQLLNDIVKTGQDDSTHGHFIGSIVYVHDDIYTSSGLKELTIIDGQQRLTTLTLIYAVLYQYAQSSGRSETATKIYKHYLTNEFAPDTEKLKLKPTKNNEKPLQCVLNDQIDSYSGFSRIIDNYLFFKSKIDDSNFESVLKGIKKLIFVDIGLDRDKDNTQRIFESLNSTGLDLSQADLIRNYILMGLLRANQEKIYTKYWEVIEKNTWDEPSKESLVSEFIRDYLTLKNKDIPSLKNVYETFKNQFPTTTLDVLENTLADMTALAKCYGKLINPSLEPNRDVSKHLDYLKQLDVKVSYPFLMQVYADYVKDTIDQKTFVAILEFVQSYVWRRFIVGLPTNALNKVFKGLYEKVDPANYLYTVQKSLLERTGTVRFPSDAEVEATLREKNIYGIAQKNKNYLFERLENYQNKEPVLIKGNSDISVEHIFPQNPDPDWENGLTAEDYSFIRDTYLHTIGNLTLSGYNGSLGNKPFLEKRDMNVAGKKQGYRFSRLWLNSDLGKKERWDKSEIEARTKRLTERFISVWEMPKILIDKTVGCTEVNIFEADDPTHKQLEYAVFFDQKIDVRTITELYVLVVKQLFERYPEKFFNTSFMKKIGLVATPQNTENISYEKLNETYFFKTTYNSSEKFRRLKDILKEFDCEEELSIKYV